jgi:hypothetical protein
MGISNRVCFAVNLRDRLCCRVCGRAPVSKQGYHAGFEYHHVQQRAHGGEDEPENLVLLCHPCHTRWHQNKLQLPDFGPLAWPAPFACACCGHVNDPREIEMNCGWYECGGCRERTHLFDHCGLGAST